MRKAPGLEKERAAQLGKKTKLTQSGHVSPRAAGGDGGHVDLADSSLAP